jgi:hypothetical protein
MFGMGPRDCSHRDMSQGRVSGIQLHYSQGLSSRSDTQWSVVDTCLASQDEVLSLLLSDHGFSPITQGFGPTLVGLMVHIAGTTRYM